MTEFADLDDEPSNKSENELSRENRRLNGTISTQIECAQAKQRLYASKSQQIQNSNKFQQHTSFENKENAVNNDNGDSVGSGASYELPPYDFLATIVCYVTRFAQMFIQVNLET